MEGPKNRTEESTEPEVPEELQPDHPEHEEPNAALQSEEVIASDIVVPSDNEPAEEAPEEPVHPEEEVKLTEAERRQGKHRTIADDRIGDRLPADIIAESETSEAEKEEAEWRLITRLARTKGIVWTSVDGIEETGRKSKSLLFTARVHGERIAIPEALFWMPDTTFGSHYAEKDEAVKFQTRKDAARRRIGSTIPVIITRAERDTVHAKYSDGSEYTYHRSGLLGSRVDAMLMLQEHWFHPDLAKHPELADREIRKGDIFERAEVLSVREDSVTVELFGVETTMHLYDAGGKEYLEDCQEKYHPGDQVRVMVTGIRHSVVKDASEKDRAIVNLFASARRAEIRFDAKAFAEVQVGGIYFGTVSHMSKAGRYIVILKNGVTAFINPAAVVGRIMLNPGDRVTVEVKVKYDETVTGVAMKY